MGLPKHLLGDDEELVMVIRSHKRVLAAPLLILVLVLAVAGLLWSIVPSGSAETWLQWTIVIVAAVVIVRWVVWPFVQWWSTVYAITSHRLVTRTGVIRRSGHDMPLARLNDVSFSHTLVQRMLGCGTIVAESGGERGQLVLRDIPGVEAVQRTLYQLAEDARQGDFGASLDEDQDTALPDGERPAAAEPVREAAAKPVREAAAEPVREAAAEPVRDAAAEPVGDPPATDPDAPVATPTPSRVPPGSAPGAPSAGPTA